MEMRKEKEPGSPREGLKHIIFVRAEYSLIQALNERLQRERGLHPGQVISRSDLARRFLYEGLARERE
jgi:hypothetical protein